MRLLIRNGYVMDPRSGYEGKRDILLDEGRILRMGDARQWSADMPGMEEYNADGLTVAPGLIDVHVH